MDRSKDRWDTIINYSNKYNIKINRFSAYNGRNLDNNSLIKRGVLYPTNRLEKGQVGCAYSHLKLWERCIKQPEKYFVILEDDIIIPPNFSKQISYILSVLPDKWDIVYIGGCYIRGKRSKDFIIPNVYSGKYNLCTHGYIINKKSIPKLISKIKPIRYPIDNQLRNNFINLDAFFYHKNIVKQNSEFESTIAEQHRIDRQRKWKENHTEIIIE